MMGRYSSFVEYFTDLWAGIYSTWKGMTLTLGYVFKRSVTMQYPEIRPEIPDTHRGLHVYDENKCVLCLQCSKVCPVECITIEALGRGKDRLIVKFDVDYSKCLFCNLCCEVCKPECLRLGKEYDLSSINRSGCVRHLAGEKSDQEIEAFKVGFAKKEAERKEKAEAAKKEKDEKEKLCGEPEN